MTPKTQRARDQITDYLRRCGQSGQEVRPECVAQTFLGLSRQGRCDVLLYLHDTHGSLAAQVQALLPPLPAVVIGYTTATADYDGFGTEEVAIVGTLDRKPLRQVEMEVAHQQWQEARYGSGMYPCFDEAGYQKLFGLAWFTPTTDAEPQP